MKGLMKIDNTVTHELKIARRRFSVIITNSVDLIAMLEGKSIIHSSTHFREKKNGGSAKWYIST
jgi:hypothetical protein